ncbi:hypothetical protein D3C87_645990 [compost metagenome]
MLFEDGLKQGRGLGVAAFGQLEARQGEKGLLVLGLPAEAFPQGLHGAREVARSQLRVRHALQVGRLRVIVKVKLPPAQGLGVVAVILELEGDLSGDLGGELRRFGGGWLEQRLQLLPGLGGVAHGQAERGELQPCEVGIPRTSG